MKINNKKIAKISAGLTILILLISYYLSITVFLNGEQLSKEVSGFIGIGLILGITIISILISGSINWILKKLL